MANRTSGHARRGRRHDPDELRRLIRRREEEGLSYARLSRESGIPVGTLASWSYRVRQEEQAAQETPRSDFVEVIPSGALGASDDVEVRLQGGIVVRVPAGTDRAVAIRVLSAVLSC